MIYAKSATMTINLSCRAVLERSVIKKYVCLAEVKLIILTVLSVLEMKRECECDYCSGDPGQEFWDQVFANEMSNP